MTGTSTCPKCGTIYANADFGACPQCVPGTLPQSVSIPASTLDRLAREWEEMKHLIPSSELKSFLSCAVMAAVEKWSGGEPPKARPLVEVKTGCLHPSFVVNIAGECVCRDCGTSLPHYKAPSQISDSLKHPISPFANTGW